MVLTVELARRLAGIAIDGLKKPYPTGLSLVLGSDEDLVPHHELTPVFYGCFDWHSAVHTTWQLVKLIRSFPDESYAAPARSFLNELLTKEKLDKEAQFLQRRPGFERPYGLAWLLQLVGELIEWNDEDGNKWRKWLEPLEHQAVISLLKWFPKLTHPIRVGEHSQTAFAMGLIYDYAVLVKNKALRDQIHQSALQFYQKDQSGPLNYEPSAHDFLSPCLAEADLMRRILPQTQLLTWLSGFLPTLPESESYSDSKADFWLCPVRVVDKTDGKLAHFDGLNLSRAWMLEGIESALPKEDSRRLPLKKVIEAHRQAGIASILGDLDYMGSHWLGSFAVYLQTRRGINEMH